METQILEKIKEYNRIIIHRHIRPDGDCMACQNALKEAILYNFPEKEVYAVGDVIPDYTKNYGTIDTISDDLYQDALAIVVDTGTDIRICDERYKLAKYIIKIDHHDDSVDYGNINYVDPLMPACAAIITRLFQKWQFKLNKRIAEILYFGIVTDTGRFRFRGINEEVLNQAGYLLSFGVDTETLYTHLYMKEAKTYKLQGYVYLNYQLTTNGVAYLYFTRELMEQFDVTKEEASNLVNSLDSIKGSLIWVVFVDQLLEPDPTCTNTLERRENEIRVRIRSRFIPINEIATHYRGGGHLCAAGATIYSKDEMISILQELDGALKEYKESHQDCI